MIAHHHQAATVGRGAFGSPFAEYREIGPARPGSDGVYELRAIADQLTAGGHLSYVYLGRGLTTQTATANSIIAYENLSLAGNGANVLYGDGHVEWGNAKLITQIIKKSASGKFPVTMPTGGN